MREYKFRGKRKDNGEWVYGYYFIEERDIEDGIIWRDIPQIQQRYGDHFQYFDVDLATVGQYTGLRDKNGKEIYEGDIVESFDHGQVRQLYLVKFNKGCFGASLDNISFYFLTFDHVCVEQIKIIGNIYENPDLLSAEVGE